MGSRIVLNEPLECRLEIGLGVNPLRFMQLTNGAVSLFNHHMFETLTLDERISCAEFILRYLKTLQCSSAAKTSGNAPS
jgi:hypothetical protein